MRRNRLVVVVLGVLTLSSCASAPEQADQACADVAATVQASPTIGPQDTAEQIVPLLDGQLAAARETESRLRALEPGTDERPAHDRLVAAWQAMLVAQTGLRNIWEDPTEGDPSLLRPGSDLVLALRISAEAAGFREAVDALRPIADQAGAPQCGAVPWRGLD